MRHRRAKAAAPQVVSQPRMTSEPATTPAASKAGRQTFARRMMRDPQAIVGAIFAAFVLAAALIGPAFAPHDTTSFVGMAFTGPSTDAPLGTDYLGEDVLSRVLYGGFDVLWMTISAATIGVAMGVVVGLVAGYTGGWLDAVLMRAQDVVLAFPQLVFVLLFVSLLGPKEWLIVVLVAIGWMPGLARTTRGITQEATTREYVKAAEALGYSRRSILFGEILPNLATPLMVEFGLRLTWSVAVISGLSFLGFGVQAPAADWGLMVNENRNGITIAPLAVLIPILMIALFAVAANLITESFARTVAGIDRESDV